MVVCISCRVEPFGRRRLLLRPGRNYKFIMANNADKLRREQVVGQLTVPGAGILERPWCTLC